MISRDRAHRLQCITNRRERERESGVSFWFEGMLEQANEQRAQLTKRGVYSLYMCVCVYVFSSGNGELFDREFRTLPWRIYNSQSIYILFSYFFVWQLFTTSKWISWRRKKITIKNLLKLLRMSIFQLDCTEREKHKRILARNSKEKEEGGDRRRQAKKQKKKKFLSPPSWCLPYKKEKERQRDILNGIVAEGCCWRPASVVLLLLLLSARAAKLTIVVPLRDSLSLSLCSVAR